MGNLNTLEKIKRGAKNTLFLTLVSSMAYQGKASEHIDATRINTQEIVTSSDSEKPVLSEIPSKLVLDYTQGKSVEYTVQGYVFISSHDKNLHVETKYDETNNVTDITLTSVTEKNISRADVSYTVDGGNIQTASVEIIDHPNHILHYSPENKELFLLKENIGESFYVSYENADSFKVEYTPIHGNQTVSWKFNHQLSYMLPYEEPDFIGQFSQVDIQGAKKDRSNIRYDDSTSIQFRGFPINNFSDTSKIQNKKNTLSSYPNPVQNILHIDHTGGTSDKAEILNMNGDVILEKKFDTGDNNHKIDVQHLPRGTYYIRYHYIENENGVEKKKTSVFKIILAQNDVQIEENKNNADIRVGVMEKPARSPINFQDTQVQKEYASVFETLDTRFLPQLLTQPLYNEQFVDNVLKAQAQDTSHTVWSAFGGNNGNTWEDMVHVISYALKNDVIQLQSQELMRPTYIPHDSVSSEQYKIVKKWKHYFPTYYQALEVYQNNTMQLERIPKDYINTFLKYKNKEYRDTFDQSEMYKIEFVRFIIGAHFLPQEVIREMTQDILNGLPQDNQGATVILDKNILETDGKAFMYKSENQYHMFGLADFDLSVDPDSIADFREILEHYLNVHLRRQANNTANPLEIHLVSK